MDMSAKNKLRNKAAEEAAPFAGWKACAALCLAGGLLYLRTLGFGLSYLDDNRLLEKLPLLSDAGNFFKLLRLDAFADEGVGSFYRPVLNLLFMFDTLAGGGSLWMYRLTNLLLHLGSCCLLLRLLGRLGFSRGAALFWSLFFCLHPALVQAVAWIHGRNDPLLAVFALGSLLGLLAWLEGRRPRDLAAHFLLFGLALFTKESAVMLVPLFALLLLVPGVKGRRKALAPPAAGWLALLIFWAWARAAVLPSFTGDAPFDFEAALTRNLPALLSYLGKAVFPAGLGILQVMSDLRPAYGLAAAALLAAAWRYTLPEKRPLALFGLAWFFLLLLPTLVQSAASVASFSEHRLYLPLAGLIVTLAALTARKDTPGPGLLLAGGALLLFWSGLAYSYSGHYKDRLSFWRKAAASSPGSAFNHNNLGAMHYLEGDLYGAERLFLRAAALNDGEPRVHGNLGLVYMDTGRLEKALPEYLREAELFPLNALNYLNLGLLRYRLGDAAGAEADWERALRLEPGLEKALVNLAVLNLRKGDRLQARLYAGQLRLRGYAVPADLAAALETRDGIGRIKP
jgi:protein O-mannosyl-transferase